MGLFQQPPLDQFLSLLTFNGRFRAECLNQHWFLTLADAAEKLEASRRYYNEERPHGAIGNKVPIMLTQSGASPARHLERSRKTLPSGGPTLGIGSINPRTLPCTGGKMGLRSGSGHVEPQDPRYAGVQGNPPLAGLRQALTGPHCGAALKKRGGSPQFWFAFAPVPQHGQVGTRRCRLCRTSRKQDPWPGSFALKPSPMISSALSG